jgi:hypothetical protein
LFVIAAFLDIVLIANLLEDDIGPCAPGAIGAT